MSRENDATIGKWVGMSPRHIVMELPSFTTSQAFELFPVLVERGYTFQLTYVGTLGYEFIIWKGASEITESIGRANIADAAISSSVLELIGREGK